jgi:hypothetical protein
MPTYHTSTFMCPIMFEIIDQMMSDLLVSIWLIGPLFLVDDFFILMDLTHLKFLGVLPACIPILSVYVNSLLIGS